MTADLLRVLLVGYGRMGRLVDSLAAEHGVTIVGRLTAHDMTPPDALPPADVAIDFSTAAAVPVNAPVLAARGLSLVIGTTGWQSYEESLRKAIARHDVGVIAAPNFAIGVNLFLALAEHSAALVAAHGFAAWIHEAHHSSKKDAPSGTALALQKAMRPSFEHIDMSSTRAGYIPGTHTVGFDSPAETITLTHAARDRTAFARGAIVAAKWIHGRRGWYTMRDMMEGTLNIER